MTGEDIGEHAAGAVTRSRSRCPVVRLALRSPTRPETVESRWRCAQESTCRRRRRGDHRHRSPVARMYLRRTYCHGLPARHFCCCCGSVRGRCAGCWAAPPRSRAPVASLPRGAARPPGQPHVKLVGRSRRGKCAAVLVGVQAKPFGWPAASLDTACGRLLLAAIGNDAKPWSGRQRGGLDSVGRGGLLLLEVDEGEVAGGVVGGCRRHAKTDPRAASEF